MVRHKGSQVLNLGEQIHSFVDKCGLLSWDIVPIAADASDRRYYRLSKNEQTVILMDSSSDISSLGTFVQIDYFLLKNGLSVPLMIEIDAKKGLAIVEDLGIETIDKYLLNKPLEMESVFASIMNMLDELGKLCDSQVPVFDDNFFFHELSIFTSWYPLYVGRFLGKSDLDEFVAAWSKPLNYLKNYDYGDVFIHKDMHCGNLFWLPDRSGIRNIGLIDFQNAKKGSAVYDLISLLYSNRFPIQDKFREELLKRYISINNWNYENFGNLHDIYLAQRSIKKLGNFTYIFQKKKRREYLKNIPDTWGLITKSFTNPLLSDVSCWFSKNQFNPIFSGV